MIDACCAKCQYFLYYPLLSDPSPIIGYACHSLTHSLPNSCLVNLMDLTLACEDANSKLVEVVTVADVDAEDHFGNSLLIWELTFGPKTKLFFQTLSTRVVQDFEVEIQQDFETGACSAFCR